MKRHQCLVVCGVLLSLSIAMIATSQELTLDKIMAHPDWIGNAPERPYWSDDSETIYYYQKVPGEERREWVRVSAKGDESRIVAPENFANASVPGGDWATDRRRKVYEREGDIYLRESRGNRVRQLTRTAARESNPQFMADEKRVQFTRGDTIFIRDLESGLEVQAADLRLEDDPKEEDEDPSYIEEQQERLLDIVRMRKERGEARKNRSREEQAQDPARAPLPFYLGKGKDVQGQHLSPAGRWLIVRLIEEKKQKDGQRDTMSNYVTESSYTESKDIRSLVGTTTFAAEEWLLLDLENHEQYPLDQSVLPQIANDPLAAFREKKEAEEKEKDDEEEEAFADVDPDSDEDSGDSESLEEDEEKEDKPRPIRAWAVAWNDDGSRVVINATSRDNKDRWLATVDLEEKKLVPLHHERDEAWINARSAARSVGWFPGGNQIYFASEQDGYAHLYVAAVKTGDVRQLTRGAWEVSGPTVSKNGKYIYFRANRDHPGVYEYYRVRVSDAKLEQLTAIGGNNTFSLSPDEDRILIRHSSITHPYELYVQRNRAGAKAERLTDTVSDAFTQQQWIEPEIVPIQSSHVDRPIYSRVYTPQNPSGAKRPAVVFVHGAGYLQNSHFGWSGYFREFMFHSLLVQQGYVVLDMDYRASAGYGRDWRTAIYRQMGTPELEDLQDGVAWMVANKNVDASRIGVYGGSYGGFMTLMALFRDPDLFACGAALRPVTDWAHYNHGYTSNILNIPELDPEAYENSSPIEFAEGLTKPLLICHGMLDDNVFYQDSVRLAQRLIELEKENWELASYPVEPHGFREPSSWLDEYRRIYKLFETHLK